MKTAKPYRPSDWCVDCPHCGELYELGSIEEARIHVKMPIECDECGLKFILEADFD